MKNNKIFRLIASQKASVVSHCSLLRASNNDFLQNNEVQQRLSTSFHFKYLSVIIDAQSTFKNPISIFVSNWVTCVHYSFRLEKCLCNASLTIHQVYADARNSRKATVSYLRVFIPLEASRRNSF